MKGLDKGEGGKREKSQCTISITTSQALLGAQPAGGEPHLPNTQRCVSTRINQDKPLLAVLTGRELVLG